MSQDWKQSSTLEIVNTDQLKKESIQIKNLRRLKSKPDGIKASSKYQKIPVPKQHRDKKYINAKHTYIIDKDYTDNSSLNHQKAHKSDDDEPLIIDARRIKTAKNKLASDHVIIGIYGGSSQRKHVKEEQRSHQ